MNDKATLSGGSNFLAGDTITFNLYAPADTTYSSPVYTDVVTITGNGTYDTSMGNTPGGYVSLDSSTVPCSYQWLASFSGDANNMGVTSNKGDEPEKVT